MVNLPGVCSGGQVCARTDKMCVEDGGGAGQRRVYACMASRSETTRWASLAPHLTTQGPKPVARPAAYSSTDIDACIRNKCIHNEGMPMPGVAMFTEGGKLCNHPSPDNSNPATPYLSLESCTHAIQRSISGECPTECTLKPIPFIDSEESCGPPCPPPTSTRVFPANQCWDAGSQQCFPIIGTQRTQLACEQDHRCWNSTHHLCYPNVTDQQRCAVPRSMRHTLNINELHCRHMESTCWDTTHAECYYDIYKNGCRLVPYSQRLLPLMPDGNVANQDTSAKECFDALHCWQPCVESDGIHTSPRCGSSCTLSTQDACSIVEPTQRVAGLGVHGDPLLHLDGAACRAAHAGNCWDGLATPSPVAGGATVKDTGMCYLQGVQISHNTHTGQVAGPAADQSTCAPVYARTLDGYVCSPHGCGKPPARTCPPVAYRLTVGFSPNPNENTYGNQSATPPPYFTTEQKTIFASVKRYASGILDKSDPGTPRPTVIPFEASTLASVPGAALAARTALELVVPGIQPSNYSLAQEPVPTPCSTLNEVCGTNMNNRHICAKVQATMSPIGTPGCPSGQCWQVYVPAEPCWQKQPNEECPEGDTCTLEQLSQLRGTLAYTLSLSRNLGIGAALVAIPAQTTIQEETP